MSILLLSGGIDSTVFLAYLLSKHESSILCLSFDYGQKHKKELDASKLIALHYQVARFEFTLPKELFSGSALTGGPEVPHNKHYEDPAQSVTVVPNRNLLFLSCAASFAVQYKQDAIYFAAHAGDASVYPDCRKEFVEAADKTMRLACGVSIKAPFLDMTKKDIIKLGRELRAPLHLAWSCYEGGQEPCWQCGACLECKEAEEL